MRPRGVILFDFDGTVCLGDAPVLAYADAAFAGHSDSARAHELLRRFLNGAATGPLAGCRDGYQAVALLASHLDIDSATLARAFARCRTMIASGEAPVTAPAGLSSLIRELDGIVSLLVTNSPGDTLPPILAHLGLSDAFDEIVASAGKPQRMPAITAEVLDRYGLRAAPARLLSIGDIWHNDLAAPAELGCSTIAIDPLGRNDGSPDLRVTALPDAYAYIHDWASSLA